MLHLFSPAQPIKHTVSLQKLHFELSFYQSFPFYILTQSFTTHITFCKQIHLLRSLFNLLIAVKIVFTDTDSQKWRHCKSWMLICWNRSCKDMMIVTRFFGHRQILHVGRIKTDLLVCCQKRLKKIISRRWHTSPHPLPFTQGLETWINSISCLGLYLQKNKRKTVSNYQRQIWTHLGHFEQIELELIPSECYNWTK